MRNLPVRAAGRTLTVGELSEALSGLSDSDPVTIDGGYVDSATPGVNGVDIVTGNASREDLEYGALDILEEIAKGSMTKASMVAAAQQYVNGSEAA